MKKRPKAPWYIDPGISANERWANKVEKALGLCDACIHTRIGIDDKTKHTILVTCSHPERQGPGKGLSTAEPCPYHLTVDLSEATPEAKEAWTPPLKVCPACKGTGSDIAQFFRNPTIQPCPKCCGTGALSS
jgi:hypothetical protein